MPVTSFCQTGYRVWTPNQDSIITVMKPFGYPPKGPQQQHRAVRFVLSPNKPKGLVKVFWKKWSTAIDKVSVYKHVYWSIEHRANNVELPPGTDWLTAFGPALLYSSVVPRPPPGGSSSLLFEHHNLCFIGGRYFCLILVITKHFHYLPLVESSHFPLINTFTIFFR